MTGGDRETELALELAGRALALRDVSADALERKLAAAGIGESARTLAVAELERRGLLDDGRLAGRRAESLASRGYGDAAIDARLAADGIDRETREEAIAALEPEADRARALVATRRREAPRRIAAFLSRRGFGADSVEAALAALDGPPGAGLP